MQTMAAEQEEFLDKEEEQNQIEKEIREASDDEADVPIRVPYSRKCTANVELLCWGVLGYCNFMFPIIFLLLRLGQCEDPEWRKHHFWYHEKEKNLAAGHHRRRNWSRGPARWGRKDITFILYDR